MNWQTWVWAVAVALMGALLIFLGLRPEWTPPVRKLPQSEIDAIQKQLLAKNAGDCILHPTEYGWKCVDKDGRVFTVRLK